MKFKTILRWLVPGYRHHQDRLYYFRCYFYERYRAYEFFRSHNSAEERETAAIQKADALITRLSQHGLNDPTLDGFQFFEVQSDIALWRAQRRIQQRKNARASRTLKNYRKKLLRLLLHRISAIRK